MMTAVTWIAVVVLGVGSVGVFAFFLRDLPKIMPERRDRNDPKRESRHAE